MALERKKYYSMMENMPDAFAFHRVVTDSNNEPVDFVFLEANPAYEDMTGFCREEILGKSVKEIFPDIEESNFDWIGTYGQVALNGEPARFEAYFEPLQLWFEVTAFSDEPGYFISIFRDITSSKEEKLVLENMLNYTQQFLDFSLGDIDYQLMTDGLLELSGAMCVVFESYEWEKRQTVTRAVSGNQNLINQLEDLMGFELVGSTWDVPPESLTQIKDGELVRFNNLYETGFKTFNKELSSILEEKFRVGEVNLIGVSYKNHSIGNFMIFMPRGKKIKNSAKVKIFAKQAGMVLMRKRMEDALHIFRESLENSTEAIGMSTPEGYHYYQNQAFTDMFGDIGNNPPQRLYADQKTGEKVFATIMAGGVWTGEVKMYAKDGSILDIMVQAYASKNDTGEVTNLVGIHTDITKRKKAEQKLKDSEERYRMLIENANEGIVVVKGDYFQFVNPKIVRKLGYSKEELYRIPFTSLVHPEDKEYVKTNYYKRYRGEALEKLIFRVYTKSGELRWVEFSGVLISWENDHAILGFVIDITERKQAEDSLAAAVEELRLADRQKDEFLGMLSHEIRNPLASITMGITLLNKIIPEGEKAQKTIDIMNRQATYLSRLVDDLLDVTRIARNKIVLKKEQVELNQLIGQCVEDNRSMFQEKGVELEFSPSPSELVAEVDPARISQVVGNLLNNSLKFTASGGQVRLVVNKEDQNELAVIKIEDNGEGMSSQFQKNLFKPFMQADTSMDRSDGGLGLGLALVKGLVEKHGGKVSAHSEGLGKGSVFTVYLPLSKRVFKSEKEPAAPVSVTGQRVLVVEDIKDTADILQDLLEQEGCEVKVAYSGEQGLQLAKDYHPDILICDIGLTGIDGYQVARAFGEDEDLRDVYLVSLTGYTRPEDQKKAKEAGFHHQLAKPVKLEELKKTLVKSAAYKSQ